MPPRLPSGSAARERGPFDPPLDAPLDPPGGRRAWVVNGWLALVLLGHLAAIALDKEAWPLSQYPMYSGLQGPRFTALRVFGVTDGGEVPLSEPDFWRPFDVARLVRALDRMGDGPRASTALAYLFRRYEELRAAGRHDGPALRGLRVYRLGWTLRPGAANADEPDAKRLVLSFDGERER